VTVPESPAAVPAWPLKLGEGSFVRVLFAGPSSVSVGSPGSTVQVMLVGVGSGLPAPSTARTWKVCEPAESPDTTSGEEHALQGPPSRRHSKPASGSFEPNRKLADPPVALGGACEKKVLGAVVSTLKLCGALVPTLLAPSCCSARTM
jgi:hypothetical protein